MSVSFFSSRLGSAQGVCDASAGPRSRLGGGGAFGVRPAGVGGSGPGPGPHSAA